MASSFEFLKINHQQQRDDKQFYSVPTLLEI